MSKQIEALKLALEALQNPWKAGPDGVADAIIAIKEALAQPEQEPVAWMNDMGTHIDLNVSGRGTPLYTTSSKRPSRSDIKPLTDEEITDAVREADFDWHYGWTLDDEEPNRFTKFARAIEAAHGIKGEA